MAEDREPEGPETEGKTPISEANGSRSEADTIGGTFDISTVFLLSRHEVFDIYFVPMCTRFPLVIVADFKSQGCRELLREYTASRRLFRATPIYAVTGQERRTKKKLLKAGEKIIATGQVTPASPNGS